jgi:hypothetical protein
MFPMKLLPAPRVAEVPTRKYTFRASAPLIRTTEELLEVISVVPI